MMGRRYERVQKWLAGMFPKQEPLLSPLEAFEARKAAAEVAALQARADYAERLRPFTGRLLLITDLGPDWVPGFQATKAKNAARIIRSKIFGPETPLGISIHYDRARTADGHRWQYQSEQLLRNSLGEEGFDNILPARGWWSHQQDWLQKITMATEATAQEQRAGPEQVGHIAVVCALDSQKMNARPAFDYGEAFLLTEIHDTANFAWQRFNIPGPPPPPGTVLR